VRGAPPGDRAGVMHDLVDHHEAWCRDIRGTTMPTEIADEQQIEAGVFEARRAVG